MSANGARTEQLSVRSQWPANMLDWFFADFAMATWWPAAPSPTWRGATARSSYSARRLYPSGKGPVRNSPKVNSNFGGPSPRPPFRRRRQPGARLPPGDGPQTCSAGPQNRITRKLGRSRRRRSDITGTRRAPHRPMRKKFPFVPRTAPGGPPARSLTAFGNRKPGIGKSEA